MTGEPDLHPLTSDEWVTYLKQLMQHYGMWSGDTAPEFTEELAAAVRSLQSAYGISPADGVVRAGTWAVLNGTQTSTPATESHAAQPHTSSAAEGHGPAPVHGGAQHGLTADPDAHAQQVPASFANHGLPSFQFTLPEVPMAEAQFETPEFSVHVEISLTGSVGVTFPHALEGATVGNEGLELEAQHAVGHLNQGIQIGGIGTHELTIADSVGSRYGESSYGLDSSGAMVFTGQAQVSYPVPTAQGDAEVEGTIGYSIKIRVTPHPQAPEEQPEPIHDESSWFERHQTLVAVGVVALFAIAVVATVATEGAAAPAAAELAPEAGAALGFSM